MKIGIIGAGFVGRAVAKQAIKAGHQVMLSNSRGPQTLFSLKPMIGCEIGTATEAAAFGDMVVIAVPLTALGQLPVALLAGKPIIDAVNYYPERDGQVTELDQQRTTTSEYLAVFLPQSKITKAFNAIQMTDLESDGLPAADPLAVHCRWPETTRKRKNVSSLFTMLLVLTQWTWVHFPRAGASSAQCRVIAFA